MQHTYIHLIPILLFSIATVTPKAGDLDPTFGGTGFVTKDVGGIDTGRAVVIQPDGKIIMAGSANNDAGFGLIRFNPDGTTDTIFGTNGAVITSIGTSARAFAIALQPDGKIVAAGQSVTGGNAIVAAVRYNPDGSLDTSFATDGIFTHNVAGGGDLARAVLIQPNGCIVLVGDTNAGIVMRLLPNGDLDPSFGIGGIVTIPGGLILLYSVVLQPDGKIIASGTNLTDFVTIRLLPNGDLDSSFGSGGIVTTDFGGVNDNAFSVALQEDGKILVGGQAGGNFALIRYLPDGTPDTSFGTSSNGWVIIDFGGINDLIGSILIQPDGKIIAAGWTNSGGNRIALARLTTDGVLDVTFGTNGDGLVLSAVPITIFTVPHVRAALQPNGRIVVVGTSPENDFLAARFLGDTLAITKEASSTHPCPGQNITYTITVENFGGGGGTVNGIFVADVLPAELLFRSAQATEGTSFDPATGVWSIPYLLIGDKATLKIKARVGQCTGNQLICNTAVTSFSSIDNVTDSSLFDELSIFDTEIFSTTECVSTLPVMYENVHHIAARNDCGIDDLNMVVDTLNDKVDAIEINNLKLQEKIGIALLQLNCITQSLSITDCISI